MPGGLLGKSGGTATAERAAGKKYYGVAVGVVTNNSDPEKMGRVKVKFPWLTEDHESNWARVCTPMSGKDWGMQCIPEVEDEVLVAFEQGDIRFPYVIGSLYNGSDKPVLKNDDGKNNIRQIKTRSGHELIFDDTSGSEKITIRDKSSSQEIVFDASGKKMTIKCGGDTQISAGGKLVIEANDIEITAKMNLKLKASSKFEASGDGGVDVKSSAITNVKGSMVNIN